MWVMYSVSSSMSGQNWQVVIFISTTSLSSSPSPPATSATRLGSIFTVVVASFFNLAPRAEDLRLARAPDEPLLLKWRQ